MSYSDAHRVSRSLHTKRSRSTTIWTRHQHAQWIQDSRLAVLSDPMTHFHIGAIFGRQFYFWGHRSRRYGRPRKPRYGAEAPDGGTGGTPYAAPDGDGGDASYGAIDYSSPHAHYSDLRDPRLLYRYRLGTGWLHISHGEAVFCAQLQAVTPLPSCLARLIYSYRTLWANPSTSATVVTTTTHSICESSVFWLVWHKLKVSLLRHLNQSPDAIRKRRVRAPSPSVKPRHVVEVSCRDSLSTMSGIMQSELDAAFIQYLDAAFIQYLHLYPHVTHESMRIVFESRVVQTVFLPLQAYLFNRFKLVLKIDYSEFAGYNHQIEISRSCSVLNGLSSSLTMDRDERIFELASTQLLRARKILLYWNCRSSCRSFEAFDESLNEWTGFTGEIHLRLGRLVQYEVKKKNRSTERYQADYIEFDLCKLNKDARLLSALLEVYKEKRMAENDFLQLKIDPFGSDTDVEYDEVNDARQDYNLFDVESYRDRVYTLKLHASLFWQNKSHLEGLLFHLRISFMQVQDVVQVVCAYLFPLQLWNQVFRLNGLSNNK